MKRFFFLCLMVLLTGCKQNKPGFITRGKYLCTISDEQTYVYSSPDGAGMISYPDDKIVIQTQHKNDTLQVAHPGHFSRGDSVFIYRVDGNQLVVFNHQLSYHKFYDKVYVYLSNQYLQIVIAMFLFMTLVFFIARTSSQDPF